MRITVELLKPGVLTSQEESQLRNLKLQMAPLLEKGRMFYNETGYIGLDAQQCLVIEGLLIEAQAKLNAMGIAALGNVSAFSSSGKT